MKGEIKTPSPCHTCSRVPDPRNCENKQCKRWQAWFLSRWALIHAYPRGAMDADDLAEAGVTIGGRTYSAPHQVRAYLDTDPCSKCLCPRDLCSTPCRVKRVWEKAKEEKKR